MKAKFAFTVVMIAALLLPPIAQARAGEGEGWRLKKRERIESVIIGKFVTELELTPEQSEQFFPKFRTFRDKSYELHRDNREIRKGLDSLSTAPVPEERAAKAAAPYGVAQLLDRQERNQQENIRLKREFLNDVSGFLTPQQVSRCSVLLDELPARIQALIQEEKMKRGHGDGAARRGK